MERAVVTVGVLLPELFERLRFRRGREREERQVRALAALLRGGEQRIVRLFGFFRFGLCGFLGFEPVVAAQDALELLHAVTAGRAMGLVDDDGEPLAGHLTRLPFGGGLLREFDDDGELLQRRDDDARGVAFERALELRGVLVDAHDGAGRVFEPGDGLLQLTVEHRAVGDDDDLVEDRRVVLAVQPRERVCRPRDGVRLARPRRVLDEPVDARAVAAGGVEDRAHRVPLVEAWEQHRAVADVQERAEQVEPRVALPYLLPQVGALVAAARGVDGRITGAARVTGA